MISVRERERETHTQITFPAVQGYLKVLVLSVSPGHLTTEGGGEQQKDGGNKERERERERTDMRDAGGK